MVLKELFFPKNYEKSPSDQGLRPHTPIASGGWGLCPQTPVCNTFQLQYTSLLNTSSNLDIFSLFLTIGLSLLLERFPSYVPAPGHGFRSSISLRPKKIPLSKFLMTSLHVISGLGPSNQKSWLRL